MDRLDDYRKIIQRILTEYMQIPYAYGNLQYKLIVSSDRNSYLLITMGWEDDTRVHGCLIHIDIFDDKIWIQRDGTEDGIANELIAAGIPIPDIVIGFHPPELRPYTKYATAI
ncbi:MULTISPECIES: XisI protein [Nostocales]|uniref:FdxN element excision controlling factor protein n=3 Tax=Nostocales TaxID=1161 RepID=A0A0C1QSF2_9CYAN|nr:XisI protein [Tolypothrix bouteillei]KAF3885693.1 XisI protein [Tolypothrix bouteillei VB521301]